MQKHKPRIRNRPRNKANRTSNVQHQEEPKQPNANPVENGSVVQEDAAKDLQSSIGDKICTQKLQPEFADTKGAAEPKQPNKNPVESGPTVQNDAAKDLQSSVMNKICTKKLQEEEQQQQPKFNYANEAADSPNLDYEKCINCNHEKQFNDIAWVQTNEAIKLIQKLLREKMSKQCEKQQQQQQQKQQEQAKTPISKSNSNDKQLALPSSTAPSPSSSSSSSSSIATTAKSSVIPEVAGPSKNAFLSHLQKQVEQVILEKGAEIPPTETLYNNLEKILNQPPVSDIESSDDEDGEDAEYIEYVYKPRQYFLVSLCNLCKTDLCQRQMLPCTRCSLVYYCSKEHMNNDQEHRQLCYALRQVAESSGNDIFYKCADFNVEQFRSFRIVNIRKVESLINRTLTATEQEVLLFPRICNDVKCREHRFKRLSNCKRCGQAAYCSDKPDHLASSHKYWCEAFQLFKALVQFQAKYGRLDPSLPSKVLKEFPMNCCNTKQILNKLDFNMSDICEYAALSQISTGPLTAWYALKLCDRLKDSKELTIHLIGAEVEFEVDVLHKWELFLLHITPSLKHLNVVFIGPELNPRNISFDHLKKTKCCRTCRKHERSVKYFFEAEIYHDYCANSQLKPDLVCFFNAGLYRSTGFAHEDTWPETILAASNFKCPVVVTSYTKYEAPLDMTRFVQESNRRLNVVLPPTINPFSSDKPERNFISDDEAPLMFKNYYCFVVE